VLLPSGHSLLLPRLALVAAAALSRIGSALVSTISAVHALYKQAATSGCMAGNCSLFMLGGHSHLKENTMTVQAVYSHDAAAQRSRRGHASASPANYDGCIAAPNQRHMLEGRNHRTPSMHSNSDCMVYPEC
jgi:hypothetical protein